MRADSRIYVTGATGLAGSAIVETLRERGYKNVHTDRVDLRSRGATFAIFEDIQPDYVINAAATIGGLQFSIDHPVAMIRDNVLIAFNVLEACATFRVKRVCVIATSCIYPRDCEQPMRESALLTGVPEPTNRAYTVGKIAAIELARAYEAEHGLQSVILAPTNLYGNGGFQGARHSHVIPSLMARMHEAKITGAPSVRVWGSGRNMREFLHADDFADAVVHFMNHETARGLINIGTGMDITIAKLAETMADVVGYPGELTFDTMMPGGMTRKVLDVSRAKEFGWSANTFLSEGLERMYAWYQEMKL